MLQSQDHILFFSLGSETQPASGTDAQGKRIEAYKDWIWEKSHKCFKSKMLNTESLKTHLSAHIEKQC